MGKAIEPTFLTNKELYLNQGEVTAPKLLFNNDPTKIKQLPDNRMLHVIPRRNASFVNNVDNIVGKCGVTTVKYANTAKNRFTFVSPSIWEGITSLGQLTESLIEERANTVPLTYFECNDFLETRDDLFNLNKTDNLFTYVLKRKELHARNNMNHFNIGSDNSNGYNLIFWRDTQGGNVSPSDQYFRNRYSSKESARNGVPFYQKGWDTTMMVNVRDYIDVPNYDSRFFVTLHNAEINAKAVGRVGGIGGKTVNYYTWGNLESIQSSTYVYSLHSLVTWERELTNPAGKLLVTGAHPQVDYDYLVAASFIIGFCICGSKAIFDINPYDGSIPNWNTYKPKINNDEVEIAEFKPYNDVPYPGSKPSYPNTPERWHDADYHAAFYYSQCGRTEGQPWKYLRYLVGDPLGTNWVEVTDDGSDVLFHAEANDGPFSKGPNKRRGRGIAMGRFYAGAADFWYYDPTLPKGKTELITVEINGDRYTQQMKAGKLNLFNM